MLGQVKAEIQIGGTEIGGYTSIQLSQAFNAHHELVIVLPFSAIEERTDFDIHNTGRWAGSTVVIRFLNIITNQELLQFKGILTDVQYELSENYTRNIKIRCSDPTILLESLPRYAVFYNMTLSDIINKLFASCNVTCPQSVQLPKLLFDYYCQYNESTYNFLNRISEDYQVPFFYDGTQIHLSTNPSTCQNDKSVDLVYGPDMPYFEIQYKALPIRTNKHQYSWYDDKFMDGSSLDHSLKLDGVGNHFSTLSKDLFGTGNSYASQGNKKVIQIADYATTNMLKQAKKIKTITGMSYDPAVQIGKVVNIIVAITAGVKDSRTRHHQGSYLIHTITHFVSETGQYYNHFEGTAAELPLLPNYNAVQPQVQMDIGKVSNVKDPEEKGRVKVLMLWGDQQLESDWMVATTPDAGAHTNRSGNRGMVCIPEVADTVLVYYTNNDPMQPYIVGSIFTGRTAVGGGENNNTKSISNKTGSNITLKENAIDIVDAQQNSIKLDGKDKINISSVKEIELTTSTKLTLKVGESKIIIEPSKITIQSNDIQLDSTNTNIFAKAKVQMGSNATLIKCDPATLSVQAVNVKIKADATGEFTAAALLKLESSGVTLLTGSVVNVNG